MFESFSGIKIKIETICIFNFMLVFFTRNQITNPEFDFLTPSNYRIIDCVYKHIQQYQ